MPTKKQSPGYVEHGDDLQTRLRRIEGQVRGVQKMVGEERYCVDILAQITGVKNALEKVGVLLLEDHIRHCVKDSLADGGKKGDAKVDELIEAVDRFLRTT
ncbi:MAG: metal-sensitive transcriptional regulator [Actinobacteria bacterium]|nr:metal-sensitive transcriptional regulator [Actinomycetota bacterium]